MAGLHCVVRTETKKEVHLQIRCLLFDPNKCLLLPDG